MTLLTIIAFILGIIIGSFLNVVIYRFNTGMTIGGRSKCFSCGKTLRWYELVPVFSFVFLRGKCGACGSRISWQYPAVELLTGALFVGIVEKTGFAFYFLPALFYAALWALLVVILVYDLRHKIIPDGIVWTFVALSLAGVFLPQISGMPFSSLRLVAGPLVAMPLFLMWLFSKGEWMGFGDVKLALGFGYMLGVSAGFAALILGFWIGAGVGIALLARRARGITMKSEVPFAPFLIAGIACAFFGSVGIMDIVNLFNLFS